jgi:hypothetical protein
MSAGISGMRNDALTVREDLSVETFLDLVELTFSCQGRRLPFRREPFRNVEMAWRTTQGASSSPRMGSAGFTPRCISSWMPAMPTIYWGAPILACAAAA